MSSHFLGPKDHIETRISNSGSKAQHKRDTRNQVLQDPHVYVAFGGSVLS